MIDSHTDTGNQGGKDILVSFIHFRTVFIFSFHFPGFVVGFLLVVVLGKVGGLFAIGAFASALAGKMSKLLTAVADLILGLAIRAASGVEFGSTIGTLDRGGRGYFGYFHPLGTIGHCFGGGRCRSSGIGIIHN